MSIKEKYARFRHGRRPLPFPQLGNRLVILPFPQFGRLVIELDSQQKHRFLWLKQYRFPWFKISGNLHYLISNV